VTLADEPPICRVEWEGAVRIIRSVYPPIDLFEDIADPADWPLLLSAEQKTNPRIRASIGNIDLVPPGRRVGPDCASSPVQGRHLDYHWDGKRVDLVRDAGSGAVFRVVEE